MNDQFTNNTNQEDAELASKLQAVAENTNANAHFLAELENKLKESHKPKTTWPMPGFKKITPALGWVAFVIVFGLALSWSIRNLIPTPHPGTGVTSDGATPTPNITTNTAIPENATPASNNAGYDWRGTKLFLAHPLPQSPADAKVYSMKDVPPATIDTARALANQFGIQGNIYGMPERLSGLNAYLVSDGKQRLLVESNLAYGYYADYTTFSVTSGSSNISIEQASTIIDSFMKSHGLDFPYRVEDAQQLPGMFNVLPLTPDGLVVWHNYITPSRIEFTINAEGQVINVSSYQIDYELINTYGVITAEEAFQQVLDSSIKVPNGVIESVQSPRTSNASIWTRTYPDNQTITMFGQSETYPAAEANSAPLVFIGQYTATGNVDGMENLDVSTYIEVTGQFTTENGILKFNVEAWKISDQLETGLSGSLRREGDQTILTADDGSGEYVIEDAPADVPLNTKPAEDYLAIYGFMVDGKLSWTTIQFMPAGSGGGGGGGNGSGFYKLNLSGTPVPFPTPQPATSQTTIEYIVRPNDTLASIAADFGVTVEQLVQANNLADANIVYVDQKLIIPGTQQNSTGYAYTVVAGDTCQSIASTFNISMEDLITTNNLPTDCSTLTIDQVLVIPDAQEPQTQSQDSSIGTVFENQRGIFVVNIYRKPDGSQRTAYNFITVKDGVNYYLVLEGTGLQELEKYHNRPITIWGTIESVDKFGTPTAKVDRFEVPFPDLQFQIIKGKQKLTEINGDSVILFTTDDGKSYIQMTPIGDPFGERSLTGVEGDDVFIEALIIPDETFGSYPALRAFASGIATPDADPAAEVATANQPYIIDEMEDPLSYTPPSATIEKVELVYYVPDPRYGEPNGTAEGNYIQPVWRFYGHYADGSEFEFVVQALKQEFLLPELAPHMPPG